MHMASVPRCAAQARRMDPSQYTTHVDGRAAEFTGRRAGELLRIENYWNREQTSLLACIRTYVAIRVCVVCVCVCAWIDEIDR